MSDSYCSEVGTITPGTLSSNTIPINNAVKKIVTYFDGFIVVRHSILSAKVKEQIKQDTF